MEKIRNNNINRLFLRYNTRLHIQQVKIRGLAHYEIRNITIKRSSVEIEIQRLELFLNLWTLIKNRTIRDAIKVQLDKLEITCHSLPKDANSKNDPVPSSPGKITSAWESVLYPKYEKIINAFFFFFPERVMIQEVKVLFPQREMAVSSSIISTSGNLIKANLETSFKNNINKYLIEFAVNKNDKSVTVIIDRNDSPMSNCLSPFSFTHLTFSFSEDEAGQKRKAISGAVRITDLRIHHPAIGATPCLINNFDTEVDIDFTPTSFVVTKESGGNINQIPFAFQFSHDTGEKDFLRFIFHVEIDVNLFKNSFPTFHIKAIRSIIAEGILLVRFRLMFSMSNPLQHFFDIKILKNDLIIKDYGEFDLAYLDRPFAHKIYKDNVFLREMLVGDQNSNFMAIEHFPDKLINIIIVCEDPNFYEHHGIDVFGIGRAIVSNIIARKFKRGGSTITMQLTRNLFLNHEKNIYRKVEEVILSLLVENYFKISKARLLEIYFNIIEFGPHIYGIKEASGFYFKKSPLALTLTEYMIMMYIIPRPIHFYEALVSQSPQLFTNLTKFVEWLSEILVNRGILTTEESETIANDIEIISQSRSIILTNDTKIKKAFPLNKPAELLRVDLSLSNAINTRNDLHRAHPLHEEGMPTVNLRKIRSADDRKESIYNVITWLDVEKSRRYAVQGKSTYCNIYAYDVVGCLGGYLPRIWWNEESILTIQKGVRVPVEYAHTVFEMNCNALANWFPAYGPCFGWKRVPDLTKMQSYANEGTIGIIVAQRNVVTEAGHITVVLPETATFLAQREGKEIICPVQSQAGMKNQRLLTGDAWWQDAGKFTKYSFWIWDMEL